MENVILVTSGKGGTGKTMFSVNLGAVLADTGRRVLLIDMDLGMRNMDLYLGMENRVIFNIMDVMRGICNLNKAILRVNGFDTMFFLAASPRRGDSSLTPERMRRLCEALSTHFDHIIIDTGAGMDAVLDSAAAAAQTAVIITEPDIAALRDADTIASHLKGLGLKDSCMVINNVDIDLVREGILMDVNTIMNNTTTPVVGLIPTDRDVRISTSVGTPIVRTDREDMRNGFSSIAARILLEA